MFICLVPNTMFAIVEFKKDETKMVPLSWIADGTPAAEARQLEIEARTRQQKCCFEARQGF